MADFWYTPAKTKLAKGDLDFDLVDLRIRLCMSNTTADTDQDAASLAAIGTIDAYDGSGYADIDATLVGVASDLAADRAEIDYADATFGAAVGAGSRQWVGLMYYVRVDGTTANDYPVAWKDLTPNNGNGGALNLTVNADGLLWVA